MHYFLLPAGVYVCAIAEHYIPLVWQVKDVGKAHDGIKMPLYAATMQHIPKPMLEQAALKCGTEVQPSILHSLTG